MPIVSMNKDTEDIVYAGTNPSVEQIVKENTFDLSFRQIDNYEDTFSYIKNRMKVFGAIITGGLGIGKVDVERCVYPSLILVDDNLPEEHCSEKTVEVGGGTVRFLNEELVLDPAYVFITEGYDSRSFEAEQYCEKYNVPRIDEAGLIEKLKEIYPVAK